MLTKLEKKSLKSNGSKASELNNVLEEMTSTLKNIKKRNKSIKENLSEILVSNNSSFFKDHQYAKNIIDDLRLIDEYLAADLVKLNYSYDKDKLLENLALSISKIKHTILGGDKVKHLSDHSVLCPLGAMHYYDAIKDAIILTAEELGHSQLFALEEMRDFFLKMHVNHVKKS